MNDVRQASDEWLHDHGRFLRRLAAALLGDEARAEDAVQDAWVAALEQPPPRNPAGWLVTVTRRLAGRSERESGRRHRRERAAARAESLPAADSVAARAEIVRRVGTVVAELPEPFRETLLLRYWEGLPPRGIADRMGVPVATVQSRTRRGLDRVRRELQHEAPGEERWQASLAVAVGLSPPAGLGAASTTLTIGAATVKAKTWITAACVMLLLTVAAAVGVSTLGAGPERSEAATLETPGTTAVARPADAFVRASEPPPRRAVEPVQVSAAVPPARHIAVLVLDGAGAPVEAAEVLAGPDGGELRRVATTGPDGRARLEHGPALLVLCARAPGWAPSPVLEAPEPESGEREVLLQLTLRGAELEVTVRDPRGAPLADARVFAGREEEVDFRLPDGTVARTAPGFSAWTDETGIARFAGLAPGWLRIHVEHPDHAAATAFATLYRGRDNREEVTLAPGIVVAGRVLDEDGRPVAGASVRRGSARGAAISAADGSYRLGPVGAGNVTAVGPEGRRVKERLRGEPGEVVRWDPVLPSSPAVRGRVVDERGTALVGWTVHLNDDDWPGWRRGVTTDTEGRFVVYGPPEGPLRLEVREVEGSPLPALARPGVLADAEELLLEVPRARHGRLVGLVEAEIGLPATDLPLVLRHATTPGRLPLTGGPGLEVVLDAEGVFDLVRVPAGSYELLLQGPPYGWHRLARFRVEAGRTTDLGELVAPEPGLLRARSWWGAPEPAADASYLLERRGDTIQVLSFRGTFPEELSLAPGAYTLQTEVTPGPQREIEFEIASGRVTEIELELAPTCPHRVRIQPAAGLALEGPVRLRVTDVEEDVLVFEGDALAEQGSWLVDVELASGRFEFVARANGLETRRIENLYTSRPGREVLLTLGANAEER
jgi:RNA polymerase sigma-70 factor (ECF subfamily)